MPRLSTIESVSCTTFGSQMTETSCPMLENPEQELERLLQYYNSNDLNQQSTDSNLKIRRSKDPKSGLDRFELRFVCYEKELPDDGKGLLTSELRAGQLTLASLVSALESHLGRSNTNDVMAREN